MEDPDHDKNGLITMALQMGMPRLDFYLNTSTGVLTSTSVLDREQIGLYHLRIIAYDAGKFPRTSTSTLTVKGKPNISEEEGLDGCCRKLPMFNLAKFCHCGLIWDFSGTLRTILSCACSNTFTLMPYLPSLIHVPLTSCNLCACACSHQFWMLTMRRPPSTLVCTTSP